MDRDVFVNAGSAGWWLLEHDPAAGIDKARRQLGEAFKWPDSWYQDRVQLEQLYSFVDKHDSQLLHDVDSAADEDSRQRWVESVTELATSQGSPEPQKDEHAGSAPAQPTTATGVDREFALAPLDGFPVGPLLLSFTGSVKFKGTIAPGQGAVESRLGVTQSTKGGHDALKVSYEQKVGEVFGKEFKLTAEREQGKGWKLGGQIGGKDFSFKLAGQFDPKKPVTAKVSYKFKETWYLAAIDMSLIGEFELAAELGFGLSPSAGAQALTAFMAGTGDLAATAELAGAACTVSVVGAAVVAAAAGAAVVGVLGLGLYMIGTCNQESGMQELGMKFADGYAHMITDLTAQPPRPKAPDAGDWKSRLEKARAVKSGEDSSYSTGHASEEAYQCGRTAVFQDVLQATGSREALGVFAAAVRLKYGEDDDQRLSAILDVLNAQVRAGGGDGIGLVGLGARR
jgi:hypothetical protein